MSNKLMKLAWDFAPRDLRGPAWTLYLWFCDRAMDKEDWITWADVPDMEHALHASNRQARAAMHRLMQRGCIYPLTPLRARGKTKWAVYPADALLTLAENDQSTADEIHQSVVDDWRKSTSDDEPTKNTGGNPPVLRRKSASDVAEIRQCLPYMPQYTPVIPSTRAHAKANGDTPEPEADPPRLRGAPPVLPEIPEGWRGGGLTSALAWARSAYGRKYLLHLGKKPTGPGINAEYRTSDVMTGYRQYCEEQGIMCAL